MIFSGENTPIKAILINTAVSIAWEIIFEKMEAKKKLSQSLFPRKNVSTSIYSEQK